MFLFSVGSGALAGKKSVITDYLAITVIIDEKFGCFFQGIMGLRFGRSGKFMPAGLICALR